MYCTNCGSNLDDKAVICPHCGCATENYYKHMEAMQKNKHKKQFRQRLRQCKRIFDCGVGAGHFKPYYRLFIRSSSHTRTDFQHYRALQSHKHKKRPRTCHWRSCYVRYRINLLDFILCASYIIRRRLLLILNLSDY